MLAGGCAAGQMNRWLPLRSQTTIIARAVTKKILYDAIYLSVIIGPLLSLIWRSGVDVSLLSDCLSHHLSASTVLEIPGANTKILGAKITGADTGCKDTGCKD
jgi:hypothetical protein